MKLPSFKKVFQHLQRGQALSEYWPIIPVGIMVSMVASFAGQGTKDTYFTVYEALSCSGLPTVVEGEEESYNQAEVGDHTIQNTASVYDPESNTTTITFTVTSSTTQAISHWVLGIPQEVADLIIDESEPWSWTNHDPKTGLAGIKFDTGYASNFSDPLGGKTTVMTTNGLLDVTFKPAAAEETYTTAREITLLLSGDFQWSETDLAVKSGTEVEYSEILAPTAVIENNSSEDSSEDGGSGDTRDPRSIVYCDETE